MLQTESQVALNTVESVEGFLTDVQSGNWCGAETHARTHARTRARGRAHAHGRGRDGAVLAGTRC